MRANVEMMASRVALACSRRRSHKQRLAAEFQLCVMTLFADPSLRLTNALQQVGRRRAPAHTRRGSFTQTKGARCFAVPNRPGRAANSFCARLHL